MAKSRVALEDELRTLKTAMRAVVDLVDDGELCAETSGGHHKLSQAVELARPLVNRPRPPETER
jgi:hypothetical protein